MVNKDFTFKLWIRVKEGISVVVMYQQSLLADEVVVIFGNGVLPSGSFVPGWTLFCSSLNNR
jgi:hypothetical protein